MRSQLETGRRGRYFAGDAMYFDEKGRSMDKTTLVADQKPLPAGLQVTSRWQKCSREFRVRRRFSPTIWTRLKLFMARR